MAWFGMVLVEEKERENKCKEDLSNRLNILWTMCPTETVKDQLMTRLQTKGYDFKIREHLKKEIKLKNLKCDPKKDFKPPPLKSNKAKRKYLKKTKYNREKRKKKREHQTVVFNYSDIELTESMEKVLNRGHRGQEQDGGLTN